MASATSKSEEKSVSASQPASPNGAIVVVVVGSLVVVVVGSLVVVVVVDETHSQTLQSKNGALGGQLIVGESGHPQLV
jgi:hypothetical protein